MTAPAAVPCPAAPIVVDLAAPGVYEGMLGLAHVIEQYIRAMPLEAMVEHMADVRMCTLMTEPMLPWGADHRKLEHDRAVLEALASAQRELVKIRARVQA